MTAVTVTRLRTGLATLLRLVRRGKTIEVYQRDELVAVLSPPQGRPRRRRRYRGRTVAGIRYGTMRGVPSIWEERPPGPHPTGALDALIDERRNGR